MNSNTRISALGIGLVVALLSVPMSSGAIVPEDATANPLCPTYDPSAWVNYCATTQPDAVDVNAYDLNRNPDTVNVCPVSGVCVDVPVVLDLIESITITVNYVYPQVDLWPNGQQAIDDACAVIGIDCRRIIATLADVNFDGVPDGIVLDDGTGAHYFSF